MIRNYVPRCFRQAFFTKGNIKKAIAKAEETRSESISRAEYYQEQAESLKSETVVNLSLVKAYEAMSLDHWMVAAKTEKDIQKLEESLELKDDRSYQKGVNDVVFALVASYLFGRLIGAVRNHFG